MSSSKNNIREYIDKLKDLIKTNFKKSLVISRDKNQLYTNNRQLENIIKYFNSQKHKTASYLWINLTEDLSGKKNHKTLLKDMKEPLNTCCHMFGLDG